MILLPHPAMKTCLSLCLGALLGAAVPSAVRGQTGQILVPVEPTAAPIAARLDAPAARPAARRLGEGEVFERLSRQVATQLGLGDGELSLSPVSRCTPVECPEGPWEATVLAAPDVKGLTAHFYLRFRLQAGEQGLGEWQLPVRAQLTQEVWVAGRQLARGETPDAAADLGRRRVDILAERQPPIATLTALDGYECVQAVPAGQPLSWRDLAPRTLVHRGQSVDVIAEDGPFVISMRAQALEDGANGANIRVRNVASQRDIDAQVVGAGKVKVRF